MFVVIATYELVSKASPMNHVTALAETLQALLTTSADRIACESGFIRRRRKVSGSNFAQTLIFAALSDSRPTETRLHMMAHVVGLNVSRQAVRKRLDDRAAQFLLRLLETAVTEVITTPVAIALLRRFRSVVVLDSSTVSLPHELANTYRGGHSGTTTRPAAAAKLTLGLDLLSGQLVGLELGAGRAGDLTSPLAQASPVPGGLHLADLSYFQLKKFARWDKAKAFWLSRLKCKTRVYDPQGGRLDLVDYLRHANQDVDVDVFLGGPEGVAARLIARRVPAEVAELRRKRLLAKSADRGDKASPLALALCDWTILVTNVPRENLSVDEAIVLARMRWQVELVFKLWKSGGGIDKWRGEKSASTLCQFYGKLLAQLVRHWMVVTGAWSMPNRSATKAAQIVSTLALSLATAIRNINRLKGVLEHMGRLMTCVATMEQRKKAPNAYQLLRNAAPGP